MEALSVPASSAQGGKAQAEETALPFGPRSSRGSRSSWNSLTVPSKSVSNAGSRRPSDLEDPTFIASQDLPFRRLSEQSGATRSVASIASSDFAVRPAERGTGYRGGSARFSVDLEDAFSIPEDNVASAFAELRQPERKRRPFSAPRPRPMSASDVWAPPAARSPVSTPEQAAKALIGLLRPYNGIPARYALKPGYTDQDLLEAIADELDPPTSVSSALKNAGCPEALRQKASGLVPLAMFTVRQRRKSIWTRPRKRACVLLVAVAEVCLVVAALVLWMFTWTWRGGDCTFLGFWESNCVQTEALTASEVTSCQFVVRVAFNFAGGKKMLDTRWRPPVTSHYGRYVWDDDPFRCCDDPGREHRNSCCNLADESGLMCDNWAGRFDASGRECHVGSWRCRFRTHEVNGTEEVEELDVARDPPVMPIVVVAGALFGVLVCLSIYWVVRAKLDQWAKEAKNTLVQQATMEFSRDGSMRNSVDTTLESLADLDSPRKPQLSLGSAREVASDLSSLPGAVPEPVVLMEVPKPGAKPPRILGAAGAEAAPKQSLPPDSSGPRAAAQGDYSKLVAKAQLQLELLPPRTPKSARGDKASSPSRASEQASVGESFNSSDSRQRAKRGSSAGRRTSSRAPAPSGP